MNDHQQLPTALIWFLALLAIFVGGFILAIIIRRIQIYRGMFKQDTRIDGKVVVITGANTGIGKETAIDLARRGGKIYMACRDVKRGEDAVKDVMDQTGNKNIYFLQLDLASLDSIRNFAKRFLEIESKLHILINNAGVMICPKMLTEDDFEMQIGVNHIGHFYLTLLLLDRLKASAPSRIVIVSSAAHMIGSINKDDLNSEKSYDRYKAYSQSKLANILFTRELAKQLKDTDVTVNCLHPGVIQTELGRYINPTLKKYIMEPFVAIPFFQTPIQGAQTQIKLAVDPELAKVTGKYFQYCKESQPSRKACDDEMAKWLWEKSLEMTKFTIP